MSLRTLLLLSFMSFVLCAACGKRAQNKDNPVLTAYRLIDEQRTDEAVSLLENELSKDPENTEYKSVLASAYAHKSGIKIQRLVPAIIQSEKVNKLNRKISQLNKEANLGQKVKSIAVDMSALLYKFAGFFDTYENIPVVSAGEAMYLHHAVQLLNEIGDKIKPEDAVYRAVLQTILMKHLISENLLGEFEEQDFIVENKCQLNLGNMNDTLIKLGKLLIDIFNDIAIASPKQAKDMKIQAQKTGEAVTNLTMATTSLIVLDEVSTVFLRQTILNNGFGKIVKCD